MAPRDANDTFQRARKFGFWIRTKREPYRAVRWEQQFHPDGRRIMRGRNWVEIMPYAQHGTREPERFYAADVEAVGPHEWLPYFPHPDEPVCGWGKPRLPEGGMQFCPRTPKEGEDGKPEAFCPLHMQEIQGEETAP